MTHKELSQAYHISREIKLYEGKLRDLKLKSLTGGKLDGMPKAGRGDKVAETAVVIADLERKIASLQLQLIQAETNIMEYISGIDDSLIRQIVFCRHIGLMSWTRTAHKVGGNNTADSCRMAYKRFMRRREEDG